MKRGDSMDRYSNGYEVYQENQISTSSRSGLLLMLYDGALKFLRFALTAMEEKKVEEAHGNLVKVQDILNELMATLNFDAGEIAGKLYSLYEYMNQELIDANIQKDSEKVEKVYGMLEELRNAWAKAMDPA
ncbi:MAG TPA: flagellar export chaperone FliS [Clostridiales bacterium]|nr:flagellar export chaperone FliS [Clostridiales bacterium]